MCFDGKAQHQLVWLHKRDFRQLNLQDEHLEHRQEVQDYLVLHSKATTGLMNEIDDQSDDLYDDSRNGDANDDGQRSETLDFVGGDRTGITRNIPEIEPQRHVKVESSTQRSGRHQLWPMARRASPAMKSLDNSDSSHFSDFVDSSE
ncbi:hypothetical protein NXS19_010941 [Fusarium pseudograminearum]|nr:hypothetical protein NXS19_010941 [Fusarium pseudograminearum]